MFPDWYACLSIALGIEEDEWYNQQYLAYIAAQGDPKKFPKRPRRYIPPSTKAPQKNPFNLVMDAVKGSGVKIGAARGTVAEYAKSRGLQKVYQMPDGTFTDKDGNPVEPTPGSVFVKAK